MSMDVVKMSECMGPLVRRLDKLQVQAAEEAAADDARVAQAEQLAAEVLREFECQERRLEQELREARGDAAKGVRAAEADARRQMSEAEQRLAQQERNLRSAEIALKGAEAHREAALRREEALKSHVNQQSRLSSERVQQATSGGDIRVREAAEDASARQSDANDFASRTLPLIEAVARGRPGTPAST